MTQEQKGKTPVLDVQNLTKIYDNGGKGDGNEVLCFGLTKIAFWHLITSLFRFSTPLSALRECLWLSESLRCF